MGGKTSNLLGSASSEPKDVYLDILIDEIPAGIIEIKLRDDIVPKTCRSFRALCLGERGWIFDGSFLNKTNYFRTGFQRLKISSDYSWIYGTGWWYYKGCLGFCNKKGQEYNFLREMVRAVNVFTEVDSRTKISTWNTSDLEFYLWQMLVRTQTARSFLSVLTRWVQIWTPDL